MQELSIPLTHLTYLLTWPTSTVSSSALLQGDRERAPAGSQAPAIAHWEPPHPVQPHTLLPLTGCRFLQVTQQPSQNRSKTTWVYYFTLTRCLEVGGSSSVQQRIASSKTRSSLFLLHQLQYLGFPLHSPWWRKVAAKTSGVTALSSLSGHRKDAHSSGFFYQQQNLSRSSQQTCLNLTGRNWIPCIPPTLMPGNGTRQLQGSSSLNTSVPDT